MLFFNELTNYFPQNIFQELEKYFKSKEKEKYEELEEIRLRVGKQIILKFNSDEYILDYIVTLDDITETLQYICENSIYSYQNQICNGYITIRGGHRIGISGSVVLEKNKVININYISSLNFRIARQVIDCSNKLLKYVINNENNNIYNTLIVSPPGARQNDHFKRFS